MDHVGLSCFLGLGASEKDLDRPNSGGEGSCWWSRGRVITSLLYMPIFNVARAATLPRLSFPPPITMVVVIALCSHFGLCLIEVIYLC